jgi:hypothetical protein
MASQLAGPYGRPDPEPAPKRQHDTRPTPPMTVWLRIPQGYVPQLIAQARERALTVDDYCLHLLTTAILANTLPMP